MIILTINASNYKDSDSIVSAFSKEKGFFTFKARGSQKNTTSSSKIKNPLTFFEASFLDDSKYINSIILKSCKSIKSFDFSLINEENIVNFNLLLDFLMFLKENNDVFSNNITESLFDYLLNDSNKCVTKVAVKFALLGLLKYVNPTINLNDDINGKEFSLEYGNALRDSKYTLSKEEFVYLVKGEQEETEYNLFNSVCFKVLSFIEELYGYRFKSIDLL